MANSDSVQQYIDGLKADLARTTEEFTLALKIEEQQLNLLAKKRSWLGFLQKIFSQLNHTDQLALAYSYLLGRSMKQASKVAGNAGIGLDAMKILICQLKQVSDCSEMLRILIGQLKDRINIPAKDGVVMTGISNLQKAIDEALLSIKNAITSLLGAFQLQEDLYKSLDGDNEGDRGVVKQLAWMQKQVLFGSNADPDLQGSCANCSEQQLLFPMETNRDYYKKVKAEYERVPGEINDIALDAANATCEREMKQAKRDALQAALTAAEAAKSCDVKK